MSEEDARSKAGKDWIINAVQDFAGGAISGGVFGGVGTAYGSTQYKKLGSYVNANENLKQSVIEDASQMEDGTTAKNIVLNKDTEQITDDDMAKILHSMSEVANTDMETVLTDRFKNLGEDEQQAQNDAREIMQAISTPSEDVTEAESDDRLAKFEQNENLGTVYADAMKSPQMAARRAMVDTSNSYNIERSVAGAERHNRVTTQTGVARTIDKSTGTPGIVIDIVKNTPDKTLVRMSDNRVVDLGSIEIQDYAKQKLYNFAATMDDVKAGNALIEDYNGEPLQPYVESSLVFFNAGRLGTSSYDSLMKSPRNARMVSIMNPGTLKEMYVMGQNFTKENATSHSKQSVSGKVIQGSGKVTDNRTDKADMRIEDVAKAVANRTGLDFAINDNLEHNANGYFEKALSRISLSQHADNMYTTMVHELNEFAESYNPEGMKKVYDAVLDYAASKEGAAYLTNTVQKYQDRYKSVESNKTYNDAAGEMVFDYLAGLFSTPEGVEQFVNYVSDSDMQQAEKKGIIQTIVDFFKGIADRINSYLSEHVLSSVAKKALEADAARANEIRQMVLDEWEVAQEKYQSADNSTVNENKKYSIDVDRFAREYDAWDGKNPRKTFYFTNKSKALRRIGVKQEKISIDSVKIIRILREHPEMSGEIIKSIPKMIYDPVLIMKSKSSNSRIVVTGELFDKKNNPVVAILELQPNGKNGIVLDEIKIASAYGKDRIQNLINTSEILYVANNNRTSKWMERTRVQFPVGSTITGSKDSIPSTNNIVNGDRKYSVNADSNMLSNSNQVKNMDNLNPTEDNDIRFSLSVDEDGIENYVTSEETRNMSMKAKKNELKRLLREEYIGRTAKFEKNGKTYYAMLSKAGIQKGIYGDKKSDKNGYKAKISIGADGMYFELAENAIYSGTQEESGKTTLSGIHNNTKAWDYFVKTIRYEGKYFDELINVADMGNGKYVYDITLIENKKRNSQADAKNTSFSQENFSKDSIPSTNNIVNGDRKYSVNADSYMVSNSDKVKNMDNLNPTEDNDIRFSLSVDEDGIENYNTSEETKSLSYSERKKKLIRIMEDEFNGRTAKFTQNGRTYYASYSKAGLNKGVYGDKKSDKSGYDAKIRIGADGNYIELAEKSKYSSSSKESGKENKFHKNAIRWDYYVKTIKCDGKYYDVLINVKDAGNEKYVYDITLKEATPQRALKHLSLEGIASKDSIPSDNSIVNIAKKYSIDVDLMNLLDSEYTDTEKNNASIIQEGFEALKNVEVNDKLIHKIAFQIRKEYKSTCSLEEFEGNLKKVFAYLKDTQNVS